jgi:hypothetical protein
LIELWFPEVNVLEFSGSRSGKQAYGAPAAELSKIALLLLDVRPGSGVSTIHTVNISCGFRRN